MLRQVAALVIVATCHTYTVLARTDSRSQSAPPRREQLAFYVSPSGNDSNPGTPDRPFLSLQKTTDTAGAVISQGMRGDIVIYLRGGIYWLSAPLFLGPSSSGQHGFRVIYESYPGERATISAGRRVTGWYRYDSRKNIYRAYVGRSWDFRQLYVNGEHAIRAHDEPSQDGLRRTASGFITSNMSVGEWKDLANVEVVFLGKWMMNQCPVAAVKGDLITLANPCWRNTFWSFQWGAGNNHLARIENAYELLNSPGQWYLDRGSGYVYYMPRPGEDMLTADVIVPRLQNIILGYLAHDIEFRNLTFAHSNWIGPDGADGYVGLQAGYHKVSAQGSLVRMHPAISFSRAADIVFQNDLFTQLGSKALTFNDGSQNISIVANSFVQLAGGAVQIGQIDDGGLTDPRIQNRDIKVLRNRIDHIGFDYLDDVAILGLYVSHMTVEHNEISDVPNTAISVGWGWGKEPSYASDNRIDWNYINKFSRVFHDSAAIYTLGPMPHTLIYSNYVRDGGRGYGCLYPDEGSAYQTWTGNVCREVSQWLHIWSGSIHANRIVGNWSDTPVMVNNGIDNTVADNTFVSNGAWPPEALRVMDGAGIDRSSDATSMPDPATHLCAPNEHSLRATRSCRAQRTSQGQ